MLFTKTPIGYIQISSWEEEALRPLSDEALLLKAMEEHKHFVISPATFAMIENRGLYGRLQYTINPAIGRRHTNYTEKT